MDKVTRDRIARDDAFHQAALARRAEAFEQEFEHRRLMLGLHRFHEFEMANIRKESVAPPKHEPRRSVQSEAGPKSVESTAVEPTANLFKQVREDGRDIAEPLYLRVTWVDSDSGGLFRWTNERPDAAGGKKSTREREEYENAKMMETEHEGCEILR